jgi:hypothetical protein
MRRRATILLHWLNFVLLILLLAGGPGPILGWAFVLSAVAMCLLAVVGGLLNGPGSKLEGWLRVAHPWLNRGMYLILLASALVTALALLGRWSGPVTLKEVHFYTLSLSGLHALFHFWRHSTLGDGALRRITPRALHGIL